MTNNIKTTFDNLLVRIVYNRASDTILIPEAYQKHHEDFYGLVLDVGPHFQNDVKVGDKILFARFEGWPVKVGDEELLVLSQKRVLGVLK